MNEINEYPTPEAKKVPRVVENVQQAIDRAWENIKKDSKEYWEVHQSLKDPLTLKGIYTNRIALLDNVTEKVFGSTDLKWNEKVGKAGVKIAARLSSGVLAGTNAAVDVLRNAVTRRPDLKNSHKKDFEAYTQVYAHKINAMPSEQAKRLSISTILGMMLRG